MMRRVALRLLHWLAAIAGVLALALVLLIWRLSAGPISLDALAPYVARSIAAAESGLTVRVEHTLLSLGPRATIDIVARGVHLTKGDGGAELVLPELAMGFSPEAALRGVAAPTHIVLDAPQLRLERAADGTFHLGLGAAGAGAGDWADALLSGLAAAPNGHGPLGWLQEVAIRDAGLTVDDRALGLSWQARHVDATLLRNQRGVSGIIALTAVEPGGVEATLRGDVSFIRGEQQIRTRVVFAELRPALFANAAPALAPLAALDLPISGEVRFSLDTAALSISAAAGNLRLGAGSLVHPALEGGRLPIASGTLSAAYDPAAGRVTLERLALDLGGPRAEVSGRIDGVGAGMLMGGWPQSVDVAGELHLYDVPADALPRFWPEQLAANAREWVTEHIHDGIVPEADARFAGHADLAPGASMPVHVASFSGTFDYRGLTVDYFDPLPPVRGVDGTATFNRAELDLVPSSGVIKGVKLTGGTAKLTQLDTNNEQIAIDFGIKGPVHDVLEVLDAKPLGYAHALNIDPAEVAGTVEGQLHFAFPLNKNLALDMVDFGARAALTGVAIREVFKGRDLTAGALQLKLDRTALRLDGTARLDDVPASLSWTQRLEKGGPPTRYRIKATLDDAARQRLGLQLPAGMVVGPIGIDATYTIQSPTRSSADISADLGATALALKPLGWNKAAGVPAQAVIGLDLVNGQLRAVRQAVIKGGGLDARLAATFDGSGRLARIEVPRLVAGATNVAGTVTRRNDGGWRIDLKGPSFDAAGLAGDLGRSASGGEQGPPLAIDAAIGRVILGPAREARNVRAYLFSDGVHWQVMSIDAALLSRGKASLRFGEAGGRRSLRLTTDNFGALLRLFDVSDRIEGGRLQITGAAQDQGPRRVLRGRVEGADYRVVRAPVLARVLSVASLSGISALLSGQGIPFTRLQGDFTVADGKLAVTALRAYGGALGIKVDGTYDLAQSTLNLSGTLVPAYTLNSALGNIPVLGPLITGGEGEGIFAANFRVAGPAANPQVTVNPLSALAPGVLRKLFLFDAPTPQAVAPVPRSGSDAPR
jgi:hypothetical protein